MPWVLLCEIFSLLFYKWALNLIYNVSLYTFFNANLLLFSVFYLSFIEFYAKFSNNLEKNLNIFMCWQNFSILTLFNRL